MNKSPRRLDRSSWLLILVWPLVCLQTGLAGPPLKIARGAGSFQFVDEKGDASKQMTVYTYLPKRLKTKETPIVFICHGHHKNAQGYRDNWAQHAEKYGFMVLAPLFDVDQWGAHGYSYGSIIDHDGKVQPSSLWSYSVIEHLFDAVKAATGNESPRYFLYGFSEGGQFVHRLVLLLPDARYARAVIGTPGWYMMPRFDIKFPYGLGGLPVTEASLKTSFGRDVILLLGERDTDPNDPELRNTRQAEAQGPHRFARGPEVLPGSQARKRGAESPVRVATGNRARCGSRPKEDVRSGGGDSREQKMARQAAP
jgi:poly(3-hydroxybutyrate) depolymerase